MPLIAVENVMNLAQFGTHVLSANEELSGSEKERFGTLRRIDHWSSITANADAWLKCAFNRVRGWNFVALWDHNLLGSAFRIQGSDDDFGTIQTAFDATIPANPGTGSVDDALGVVTLDKMWLKRVPTRTTAAVRLYVPAMGAGRTPQINGIVGMAYSFDRDFGDLPESTDFLADETRTEAGYVGRGTLDQPRSGVLPIRMPSMLEWEAGRYHLQERFARAPGVLIFDELRAEQGFMAIRPTGRQAPKQDRQYFYPRVELAFREHEPREFGT